MGSRLEKNYRNKIAEFEGKTKLRYTSQSYTKVSSRRV